MEQRFLAPEFKGNVPSRSEKQKQPEEIDIVSNDGYELELKDQVFNRTMRFRYIKNRREVVLASDEYGELKDEYPKRVYGLINKGQQLANKYLLCDEADRRRRLTDLKRKQMNLEQLKQ